MKLTTILKCISKRTLLKREVWNVNIRQTTASRHIREHADLEMAIHNVDLNTCSVCGSVSHTGLIDVAHMKASSSFTDDTPLGEINHIFNLLTMCKTCHRKFDLKRHDKSWSDHQLKVIEVLRQHQERINYIYGDVKYKSPVDLDLMVKFANSPFYYEPFFEIGGPLVIKPTGDLYSVSDSALERYRQQTMEEMTNNNTVNGSPYFNQRQHAKFEAYRHGMFDDYRCLLCTEKMVCDLSHVNRLCDIPPNTPMGVVNHIHNLVWLCPNHNHLLDNPPTQKVDEQYKKEYEGFLHGLQTKLLVHRNKYKQIPIQNSSFSFNALSFNNWKLICS
jgi:hypothetical protein